MCSLKPQKTCIIWAAKNKPARTKSPEHDAASRILTSFRKKIKQILNKFDRQYAD